MAIDFPIATQVGQTYTDPGSGSTFVVTVVGPPAQWVGSGSSTNLDATYLRKDASNDPVTGTLTVTPSTNVEGLVVTQGATQTAAALRITNEGSGNALIIEDSANPDSTPVVIDNAGRVGIGTSSLDARLQVNQTIPNGANTFGVYPGIVQIYNSQGISNSDTSVKFVHNFSIGDVATGEIGTLKTDYFASLSYRMFFRTGGTERMTIDSSGNVMIGTSTPGRKLSVNTGDGDGILIRGGGYTTLGSNATLYLSGGTFNDGTGAGFAIASEQVSNGNHVLKFCKATADAGATNYAISTERMRIDSSGRVGIGATAPNCHLHVFTAANNDSNIARFTGAQGDRGFKIGTYSANGNDGGVTLSAWYQLDIIANSAGGVRLNQSATSWSAISDERLKTNLAEIENGLDKVGTLRAVTGRYTNDSKEVSRSFLIAQDVQAVLPEAVSEEEDEDGTLSLRYSEVIPLLVAALKESKERIETLEAKVAALEAQ